MLNKPMDYALAFLLALSLLLGFGLWRSVSANGALKVRAEGAEQALGEAAKQRKLDQGLLARAEAEKRSQRLKFDQERTALSAALRASEAWAATQVPEPVRDALTEAVKGIQ